MGGAVAAAGDLLPGVLAEGAALRNSEGSAVSHDFVLVDGHEDAFGKVVDLAAQFGSGVGLLSVDFGRKGGYLFGVRGDGVSGKKFLVGGFHPERVIRRGGEAFREYR